MLLLLAGCNEGEEVTETQKDIETFSRQLEGTWELEGTVIIPVHKSTSVRIAPINEFACNKLAADFEKKDVVSKYTITLENNVLKVMKFYTCLLPPEQLSWTIEPDVPSATTRNWMTGKNFSIKEVNEAAVQAVYSVLFFNLDNVSPTGLPATADTANKLWLDVVFDTKESSSSFRLEFKKVK